MTVSNFWKEQKPGIADGRGQLDPPRGTCAGASQSVGEVSYSPLDFFSTQTFTDQLKARHHQFYPGVPLIEPPQSRGSIPKLHAVLAAHPTAQIAVCPGGFHYSHHGHLELVLGLAGAELPEAPFKFDRVLVVPIYAYEPKPFLQDSYLQRVQLLRDGLNEAAHGSEEVAHLVQRIIVADNSAFASSSWDLMERLVRRYPRACFSYGMGSDNLSLMESHQEFSRIAATAKYVVYVERSRHRIDATTLAPLHGKATRLFVGVGSSQWEVSSTEIRAALACGDVEKLSHRVPTCTLAALRTALYEAERARQKTFSASAEVAVPFQ